MPSAIVMDLTFDEADAKTTLNEFTRSNEAFADDRPHEMDMKIDGREILPCI
jgi:hypothetical protein